MTASPGFREFIQDQLSEFGTVSIRRMFSGAGVFAEGLMFALIVDDTLYLKADAESSGEVSALGLKPFTYKGKNGKPVSLGYYAAPSACLEQLSEMTFWARKAHAAARRSARKMSRRPKD